MTVFDEALPFELQQVFPIAAHSIHRVRARVNQRFQTRFAVTNCSVRFSLHASGDDDRSRFGTYTVHARDIAALIAHWGIRESEPGGFIEALAVYEQRQVFAIARFA